MDDREQMIRLINIESDTKIMILLTLAQKILKMELHNVKVNIVLTIAALQASNNENIIFFQLRYMTRADWLAYIGCDSAAETFYYPGSLYICYNHSGFEH